MIQNESEKRKKKKEQTIFSIISEQSNQECQTHKKHQKHKGFSHSLPNPRHFLSLLPDVQPRAGARKKKKATERTQRKKKENQKSCGIFVFIFCIIFHLGKNNKNTHFFFLIVRKKLYEERRVSVKTNLGRFQFIYADLSSFCRHFVDVSRRQNDTQEHTFFGIGTH